MRKLCLVTYTRSGEGFTPELYKIADALYNLLGNDFKVVICCEAKFELEKRQYEMQFMERSGTKYRRLIELMDSDDSDYYLSIDNDITGNIPVLRQFVTNMISDEYEVGWGRIRANKQKDFISNMVAVDKLLSHNIIRPLLWKMKVGISIPGQIFCIRGETFRNKLMDLDTFLDDLALGLYVNSHHNKKYIIADILGYEKPNSKFSGLWRQRSRWAIGYASILKGVFNNKAYLGKILIHGISYHASWILNWVIIGCLWKIYFLISIAYMMLMSMVIVGKDISMIFYAFIYQIFFPLFHIRWAATLMYELVKVKE